MASHLIHECLSYLLTLPSVHVCSEVYLTFNFNELLPEYIFRSCQTTGIGRGSYDPAPWVWCGLVPFIPLGALGPTTPWAIAYPLRDPARENCAVSMSKQSWLTA